MTVLSALHQRRRPQRRFLDLYDSDAFDEICKALLLYFVSKLEYNALENARLKGQDQAKLDVILQAMNNKTPYLLEADMKTRLTELCPLYVRISHLDGIP
jgi:hypothetical protein